MAERMSDQEYTLCRCGKRCLSRREANQAINDAKRCNQVRHMKHIPKRAYRCPLSDTWHTTSQPERNKREYSYRDKRE
jgi:hypothetical protein